MSKILREVKGDMSVDPRYVLPRGRSLQFEESKQKHGGDDNSQL